MKEKAILSWSGGKDSAFALYEIQKSKNYKILSLLTTITKDYGRVSMHGVRQILLEHQAQSLALPLHKIFISKNTANKEYESKMREILTSYLISGTSSVIFGDIFLEAVKKGREDNLSKVRMKGTFPIWKRNTKKLARAFIDLGFKAIITCVDSSVLDKLFVGRVFDQQFISKLPPGVDPCGENGEFHTFVYDGPIFKKQVPYRIGKVILRDNRFYYCDLVPTNEHHLR